MIDWNQVLSIVTVIATVVLAVVAYSSFKEVKRQADVMEKQSGLMRENMEYDRLTRKYDKLNKEIDELVGPLYSKEDDYLVFESAGVLSNSEGIEKYKIFWKNIKEKMYLADKVLALELQNYFLAIENYKNSGSSDAYGKHFSDEAKNEFIAEKDKLIRQIGISYERLQKEINETELKLEIQ